MKKRFVLVVFTAFFLFPDIAQAACTGEKEYVRVMKESYWDKVAKCETRNNWKNTGNWAGGLGIARITWKRFGGKEFASRPELATKAEQIIIANRVSVLGYQTKDSYLTWEDRVHDRPHFRRPVGFFGWGCIKYNEYLHPYKYKMRKQSCPMKLSK